KEELEKALKAWGIDVDATSKEITISTKGNTPAIWVERMDDNHVNVNAILDELKYNLSYLPELPEMPDMPEIPDMPALPALPEGINELQFDYEAYKKDGEKYMEKWSKNFESKFGDDYAKQMEAWGERFGEEWGEKYGKQMEAWGERYAERLNSMEERREAIQEQREAQRELIMSIREKRQAEREQIANEREKLADERRMAVEKIINTGSASNVKKT